MIVFVNVGPSTENAIPKIPNISPTKFLKNRNCSPISLLSIFDKLMHRRLNTFVVKNNIIS